MEPSDLVLGICNAYESGYGHGYDQRNLTNPYCHGSYDWQGWEYGYSEGNRKRQRHDENGKEPSVIVPQYQIDKVEDARKQLCLIGDVVATIHHRKDVQLAIQTQTERLWEVANRKYEKV